ncbi:MAG TPA: hypothetical protein VF064_18930 [Pyrinomonadaceae bacterium]
MSPRIIWSRVEEKERRVRKLLERWRGGVAVISGAQVSHKWLILSVDARDKFPRFLEIYCGDCEYVAGPFKWAKSAFELERRERGSEEDFTYILRDESNGFTVHCGIVEAKEKSYSDLK